uniref:Zymogen granule protein 16 n=1 Tax=Laticauda laticaudata TaxID=8630 RepID=A0A8C5SAP0_LATLA
DWKKIVLQIMWSKTIVIIPCVRFDPVSYPKDTLRTKILFIYSSLQVRYGKEWSNYVGGSLGDLEEIFLFPRESIIQVSGKYSSYICKLVFVTDEGHYFSFGKDYGTSFNGAPLFPNTVLRFFSGHYSSVISSIGFHSDKYPGSCNICQKGSRNKRTKKE